MRASPVSASVSELMDDPGLLCQKMSKSNHQNADGQGLGIPWEAGDFATLPLIFRGRMLCSWSRFRRILGFRWPNKLMKESTRTSIIISEAGHCNRFQKALIINASSLRHEGQLNTMHRNVYSKRRYETSVLELGVKFIFGTKLVLRTINNQRSRCIFTSGFAACLPHLIFFVPTGLRANLFPPSGCSTCRNLVCVTEEIAGLKWNAISNNHFDKGYYYFRRIGNRILLGGARNLEPEIGKLPINFEFNEHIRAELIRFFNRPRSARARRQEKLSSGGQVFWYWAIKTSHCRRGLTKIVTSVFAWRHRWPLAVIWQIISRKKQNHQLWLFYPWKI